MTKNICHFILLIATFLIIACEKVEIEEGTLKGTTGMYIGNCMPGPDVTPCTPINISTTVAITQLTDSFNMSLLVDSVISKNDGSYEIKLKPGRYSVFLRDSNQFVSDYCQYDVITSKCIAHPIEIKKDSILTLNINLDHAAW